MITIKFCAFNSSAKIVRRFLQLYNIPAVSLELLDLADISGCNNNKAMRCLWMEQVAAMGRNGVSRFLPSPFKPLSSMAAIGAMLSQVTAPLFCSSLLKPEQRWPKHQ